MADVLTEPELSGYLHGELDGSASAVTVALFVGLTNALIHEVIGTAPVTTTMRTVALEVAARGYRTSRGYTSVTASADGTSKTWRRDGVTADGKRAGVYLTPEEKADLLAEVSPAPVTPRAPIRMEVPVTWPTW
jgi:hypothetical protein